MEYYSEINLGEVAICNKEWETATKHYNKAFLLVKSPFAKDLHNAAICYLEQDNLSEGQALVKKLISKGAELSYFQNQNFAKILNSKAWESIESEYKVLRHIFERNFNKKLRKEVMKRYKLDQAVEDTKRKIYFKQNILWLKKLFELDSFPSEHSIGIYTSEEVISPDLQELFLLHWSELDKADTLNLLPFLYKNINNGNLHPCSVANFSYDSMDGKIGKMKNFAFIVVQDSVLSPIFNEKEKKDIDSLRVSIGLHKFDDYVKIVKFGAFDNRFIFNNMRYVIMDSKEFINLFKQIGYEVIGDKKKNLNLR